MSYDFFGKHYIASYLDCDYNALINIDLLKKNIELAIINSGATIINSVEKKFDNNGYTIIFLLSESHCSIHTYPEHKSIFTDLFTCGINCSHEKFEETITKYLSPIKINKNVVIRNQTNDIFT